MMVVDCFMVVHDNDCIYCNCMIFCGDNNTIIMTNTITIIVVESYSNDSDNAMVMMTIVVVVMC